MEPQPTPPPHPPRDGRVVWPRVPTLEAWQAMSERQQDQAVDEIMAILESQREAMSEGTRHSRPKVRALTNLGEHFGRTGRKVFLATELAVLYPGEEVIVPDLLAVLDIDPDREMDRWIVAREGRGIDLVVEFRNQGKKHKDVVENVCDYARLGITEYFSMDCRGPHLRGWRLPKEGARTYVPILGQGGRFPSGVLDLELAIVGGRLRFFQNQAQVPESVEIVQRLEGMIGEREAQLALAEQQRLEAEQQRLEAEQRRLATLQRIGERVLSRLRERGLAISAEQEAQVRRCDDADRLLDWLDGAVGAADTATLLRGG